MKKKVLLHKAAFFGIWIVCLTVLLLFALIAGVDAVNRDVPTLFYNDTAWQMDDYYPALGYTTGAMEDFWIPLSFFEEIESIKVRRGPSKNITFFVISDTESGKYLSFNIVNSEYAQTERGTYLYVRTTLYSKERYLPMRDMCAYFGWSFEINKEMNTVRITDGGQKKTFDEILEPYRPKETVVVTTEEVTTVVTTELVTQPETETAAPPIKIQELYRASLVYLTFEDIEDVYTPQLLDLLAEAGYHASFFVTGQQLSRYPDMVLRILSEGHALGLHTMTGEENDIRTTDTLLDSLKEENELLYALTKRKTRLVRLPEGSHSRVLYLNQQQKKALSNAGYLLWDWNIESMDINEAYDADMVFKKIDDALKISYYPVVRFHCSEVAVTVLPRLLEQIRTSSVMTVEKITEDAENIVFP